MEVHSAWGLFLLLLGPSFVGQRIRKGGRQKSKRGPAVTGSAGKIRQSLLLVAVGSRGKAGTCLGGTETLWLSGKCPVSANMKQGTQQAAWLALWLAPGPPPAGAACRSCLAALALRTDGGSRQVQRPSEDRGQDEGNRLWGNDPREAAPRVLGFWPGASQRPQDCPGPSVLAQHASLVSLSQ